MPAALGFRIRDPLLPREPPGPARRAHRPGRGPGQVPDLGGRLGTRRAGAHIDGARLGVVARRRDVEASAGGRVRGRSRIDPELRERRGRCPRPARARWLRPGRARWDRHGKIGGHMKSRAAQRCAHRRHRHVEEPATARCQRLQAGVGRRQAGDGISQGIGAEQWDFVLPHHQPARSRGVVTERDPVATRAPVAGDGDPDAEGRRCARARDRRARAVPGRAAGLLQSRRRPGARGRAGSGRHHDL